METINEEITHLDLCSGIGGFALAIADAGRRTDRDVSTIAFCEPDKFCQQVLGKHWPEVPIYEDVKTFPSDFGNVNVLTAGYPCQPFSQAGQRKGTADDRHIWPWVLEIVKQTRPTLCVFENVVGHLSMGIDEVLLSLSNAGYHAWPLVFGAVSKNAPHRRQRVWIIAYAHSHGEPDVSINDSSRQRFVGNVADTEGSGCAEGNSEKRRIQKRLIQSDKQKRGEVAGEFKRCDQPCGEDVADPTSKFSNDGFGQVSTEKAGEGRIRGETGTGRANVADTQSVRIQGHRASGEQEPSTFVRKKVSVRSSEGSRQADSKAISRLGRTFDGLSSWVDGNWERGVPRVTEGQKDRAKRLKALGNAIVPQVASEIFTAIFESELI